MLLGGTVCVVGVLSIWWCLWRGGLPSVDRCAALLAEEEKARPQRLWVSMVWGWVAWLLTIQPLALKMYPLWVAPIVVVAWCCLLFSPPSALRTRTAARVARRVREGLSDPSPVVRGWAATVVVFVVCEFPELPLLRWRLTVGSPGFDDASLLFRRRLEAEEDGNAVSRRVLFHMVEAMRLSSMPSMFRDRARVLMTAVRAVWSSPVLEQTVGVAFRDDRLVQRADALEFISTAWFLSRAFDDVSCRDPQLFCVGSSVMMAGGSDAPYSSEPFLRGASRGELRHAVTAPPAQLVARADLAVAMASSWHFPEPEYRFGVSSGRTDSGGDDALVDLVEAVWALVPDPVLRPADASPGVVTPGEAML